MGTLSRGGGATAWRWREVRRLRAWYLPVLAAAVLVLGLFAAHSVGAQGTEGSEPAAVEDSADDLATGEEGDGEQSAGEADREQDREAEQRVERIVLLLVAVAALVLLLTALFWYHTIPSRRVIAARRRRARESRAETPQRDEAPSP